MKKELRRIEMEPKDNGWNVNAHFKQNEMEATGPYGENPKSEETVHDTHESALSKVEQHMKMHKGAKSSHSEHVGIKAKAMVK